jgi:hypothetical protein
MNKFNVTIIGGGLGGLIAGANLAKLGKKVLLLEQHNIPGGCATAFKRKDFVMEVGLHEMDGLCEGDSKVKIFDSLGVFEGVDFKEVPDLFNLKSHNPDFVFQHGRGVAEKALLDRFPDEKKGIENFFKTINKVSEEINKMPQEK